MRNWSGEIAIVGIAEYPHRKALGVHPFEIHARCVLAALADAGLTLADVDGLAVSASGTDPAEGVGYAPGAELAEYLGIRPTYIDSSDLGGAAPLAHIAHAGAAIAAGQARVVVVSYAANNDFPANGTARRVLWGPDQFEVPYGPTAAASYALAARRHMALFGTTSEQLAEIAVACRAHAGPNEHARYRDPITVQDVLDSPVIASPLHRLDCCVVTSGGGAVVVTSARRSTDGDSTPVLVLGAGEAASHARMDQMADFTASPARLCGPLAFAQAGVSHDEVDTAQLYDSFTITVLLSLEDLGFCEKGTGGEFVSGGRITLGGDLPINTDGGGLSSNHPGRRGIFTVIEAVRQLRGEAVGVQVPGARVALAHGSGGRLASASVLILARD